MTDTKQSRDPEVEEYEKNFDFERHERELMGLDSSKRDAAEEARVDQAAAAARESKRMTTRQREVAPAWDTNLTGAGAAAAATGGGGGGRFNLRQMLKKRVNQWIIGGIVTLIITVSAAIPSVLSSAFVHMKELASDWGNKNNHGFFSRRQAKILQKRLFSADKDCKTGITCRFKKGVSDDEIKKYKDAGLKPEIKDDGNGVKHIEAFHSVDGEGKPIRITSANFAEHYSSSIGFRGQMDFVAKPKAMFLRGKVTLTKVFAKFGAKRNRTVDGKDEKERNKNFRADAYGEGNDTEKANAPPDDPNNKQESEKLKGVDDAVKKAAQEERDRLVNSGFTEPPSIVPDTTNLDLSPDKAGEVATGIVKGGIKGAVLGVFSGIDKACSGYQLIRAMVFGAKMYKAFALIKYAVLFLSIADKLKAGDASATEIGYMAGLLMRPSTKKESYGKTFFQSEGFNLIFQGKIGDHRGLARYSTGTPFLRFLQGAKKTFEQAGANKTTCKQVKSWYGQGFLFIAGLTIDIFTGGGTSVGGLLAGAGLGMIVSILVAYVTPLLIQYAAGTVLPDPTDAEGGYAIGNAIGAGIGAFGGFAGRANGIPFLNKANAKKVALETEQDLAFERAVENHGKNPFSLDNANSITSQLAIATAPYMAAPLTQGTAQSVASLVTSPFSLFSSAFGSLMTRGASAQNDGDRGGQYCADEEYLQLPITFDAWCNPVPGKKREVIEDKKYDPNVVSQWMKDNKHVDDEGNPISDKYKKYLRSCPDGVAPISPDGGGSDVGEDIDTRMCMDTEDVDTTMFSFFNTDGSADSAYLDSVHDKLGDPEGGAADGIPGGAYSAEKCKALTDQGQKIACNATAFEPYYYLWGGGHGSISSLKKIIDDAVNGRNKGAAIFDCSGLVRAAYYMTIGVDVGAGTANGQAHSKFFKPVDDSQAKPGDILWHSSPYDHTAIVMENDPAKKTWKIVNASTTGKPINERTASYGEFQAFTYTGAK